MNGKSSQHIRKAEREKEDEKGWREETEKAVQNLNVPEIKKILARVIIDCSLESSEMKNERAYLRKEKEK